LLKKLKKQNKNKKELKKTKNKIKKIDLNNLISWLKIVFIDNKD